MTPQATKFEKKTYCGLAVTYFCRLSHCTDCISLQSSLTTETWLGSEDSVHSRAKLTVDHGHCLQFFMPCYTRIDRVEIYRSKDTVKICFELRVWGCFDFLVFYAE